MEELDLLISRFKDYNKIPFKIIKLINQMIIFSYGMMSEYSFENIFLEKYHISISKDEMLEFFNNFKDIYQLVEGEDVALDEPFISYKSIKIKEALIEYLKDVYEEAICLIYLEYSKYRFNPFQENIFFILRCRALLALGTSNLYQELISKDELFLGYYEGMIRYKENDKILEKYVKDMTLDKALLDYINDENDLIDKCINIISMTDKEHLMKIIDFINNHVLKVYQESFPEIDISKLSSLLLVKLENR